MTVIAGDVVIELIPKSLDRIVVRGVRGKEVQHDSSMELSDLGQSLA